MENNVSTCPDLPNEIWSNIFSFLSKRDQHSVGIVNVRFQELVDNIKIEEDSILKITEENVGEIRAGIENQNGHLSFKRVQIENVTNIENLKFILQSIGKQIDELSMKNTEAFDILRGNLRNLRSLELHFDNTLERSLNDNVFNLRLFPLLEKLIFINNKAFDRVAVKLLTSLCGLNAHLNLKYLKLECTPKTEKVIHEFLLSQTVTLESLHIDFYLYFNFCKEFRNTFPSMENLIDLSISDNYSSDIMASQRKIFGYRNRYLRSMCNDDFLKLVIKTCMHTLQRLELRECTSITDTGFKEISKLQKLRFLNITDNEHITNAGFLNGIAAENNPNMEELHLSKLPKVDGAGLQTMLSRFPNLCVLNIDIPMTNITLATIFCHLTRLRVLSLKDSKNITNEDLIGFGDKPYSIKRLRFLKKVNFDNCRHLTDRTLIDALILPKLRSLELDNIHRITSKGIKSLVKNCPSLEFLSISSTVMCDDDALLFIGNGLMGLRQLLLTDCVHLTENDRQHMKDVLNALQDPLTKKTFSSRCELIMQD